MLKGFGRAADECEQVINPGVRGEVAPEVVLNFSPLILLICLLSLTMHIGSDFSP